jgi:hypothetical protein
MSNFKIEPIPMKKDDDLPLLDKEKETLSAEVRDWRSEELAYVLSLLPHEVLFAELKMRMGQMKFQIDVIKGIVE